jgi:tetratricopeptide (TPR) repeat protein
VHAQLHGKVGAALESERAAGLPVTPAELAMHFERGREPMRALHHYVEAAQAALLRLSPGECMTLTERAMHQFELAGEGTERDALELDLSTLRGLAAFHLQGASIEAKEAFQRAHALLGAIPQHPRRGLLLHNFGFVLGLRAEYAEALALAHRTQTLAAESGDAVLRLAACTVQSQVLLVQGGHQAARAAIESVLPALEAKDVDPAHGITPVSLLGLLGLHLLHLGRVRQAHARMQQAYALAARLGQPMAKMRVIWLDALMQVRLGNAEALASRAADLRALVEESDFGHGRAAWRWFAGLADARNGKPHEGLRLIQQGHDENARLVTLAGASEKHGYAAEALLRAGDVDGAQAQLEQALRLVSAHDERGYLPQLLLIEAAIARARGQPAAAVASARRAIEEARAQPAPWLELLALVDLCEHDGAGAKDRRALAALVDALPEADDTLLVARARTLIRGASAA